MTHKALNGQSGNPPKVEMEIAVVFCLFLRVFDHLMTTVMASKGKY